MTAITAWLRHAAAAALIAGVLTLVGLALIADAGDSVISAESQVTAGGLDWQSLDPGFEAAELPVLADGREVDRVMLARIDPGKFRFVLRAAPGGHTLEAWRAQLGAAMVINGGFFARDGAPATPMLSGRQRLGPPAYDARHGAFVASDDFTGIRDLRHGDWTSAFRDAEDAAVSFPLLLGADGGNSALPGDRRASRSFVGQDRAGRVILGTTRGAAFALDRLAAFLKASPLDLELALNLDGGPYACQAIAFKGHARNVCGLPEFAADGEGGKPASIGGGGLDRLLPIVIGVLPR